LNQVILAEKAVAALIDCNQSSSGVAPTPRVFLQDLVFLHFI